MEDDLKALGREGGGGAAVCGAQSQKPPAPAPNAHHASPRPSRARRRHVCAPSPHLRRDSSVQWLLSADASDEKVLVTLTLVNGTRLHVLPDFNAAAHRPYRVDGKIGAGCPRTG